MCCRRKALSEQRRAPVCGSSYIDYRENPRSLCLELRLRCQGVRDECRRTPPPCPCAAGPNKALRSVPARLFFAQIDSGPGALLSGCRIGRPATCPTPNSRHKGDRYEGTARGFARRSKPMSPRAHCWNLETAGFAYATAIFSSVAASSGRSLIASSTLGPCGAS